MKKPSKNIVIVLVIGLVLVCGGWWLSSQKASSPTTITSTTTENKNDKIVVNSPKSGAKVSSSLTVTGQARGTWFFEASFPVALEDATGKEVATGIAQAQGEWMTEDFVPFSATLTFATPTTPTGTLVLKKDNPSGLPENEDSLRILVSF